MQPPTWPQVRFSGNRRQTVRNTGSCLSTGGGRGICLAGLIREPGARENVGWACRVSAAARSTLEVALRQGVVPCLTYTHSGFRVEYMCTRKIRAKQELLPRSSIESSPNQDRYLSVRRGCDDVGVETRNLNKDHFG